MAEVSPALKARDAKGPSSDGDGDGDGAPLVPVAFDCKGTQVQTDERGTSPPLRAMGHNGSHQNAGGQLPVAYGIRSDATRDGEAKTPSADAEGWMRLRNPEMGISEGVAPTMDSSQPHAVAFDPHQVTSKANRSIPRSDVRHTMPATTTPPHIAAPWAVRRLTPTECERLMGFPDGYTDVPWRGKDHSPHGHRYKALGNSMAVNVMQWIGERIQMAEGIEKAAEERPFQKRSAG